MNKKEFVNLPSNVQERLIRAGKVPNFWRTRVVIKPRSKRIESVFKGISSSH